MPLGGTICHPIFWFGVIWELFALSASFRRLLWEFDFSLWHRFLVWGWHYTNHHPWVPFIFIVEAVVVVLIRYFTSYYALNDDYIYIQTGLLSFGSPGGPLRVYCDPIPMSTIVDANDQKGLIGFITGTGTLFVKSSEAPNRVIKLTWVPHVNRVQRAILARAGVRTARILSTMRSN